MRKAISTDPETGTSRWQEEDSYDASWAEILEIKRHCYERQDVAVKKSAPVEVAVPMAETPWVAEQVSRSTADVLRYASDVALRLEMIRRGRIIAGKILGET